MPMLEELLASVVTELQKNTAALLATSGKAAPAAAAAGKATTTAAAAKATPAKAAAKTKAASQWTAEQVQAKAIDLKNELGAPTVREMIGSTGAKDLNDLVTNHEDKWDAFIEACDAKMAPDETPAEDEDEDRL